MDYMGYSNLMISIMNLDSSNGLLSMNVNSDWNGDFAGFV